MAKVQNLKTFQEEAVRQLRKQFLGLWKTTNRKLPLIFKAPTGSGKTVMVAQFLKDMSNDPQFDVDKAYLCSVSARNPIYKVRISFLIIMAGRMS